MTPTPTRPHLLTPGRIALVLALVALAWLTAPPIRAQMVESPFDADYSVYDLGSVPDLPPSYGGLTFSDTDPNVLLIGGQANSLSGGIYQVTLVRDAEMHVIGFAGPATEYAPAPYPDGGLAFGPADVLFMTRWPVNEVAQLMPGSGGVDKVIELGPMGVTDSPGGLNFVPEGFPGAGQLKMVTWANGEFYTLGLTPDGSGTYDIPTADFVTSLPGGPEGFVYVPAGSPQFDDYTTMLVSEYDAGSIAAYDIDGAGNPVPATRRTFVSNLAFALGATIDPMTGDYLFSTYGAGDRVVAVRGFAAPDGGCDPQPEVCDNGLDDDCDELVDGDDTDDCGAVCVDEDGDGYGTAGSAGCAGGDMVDCDDSDAAVHPGAGEVPGTTTDENCDGVALCDACADWWNHGQFVSCVSTQAQRMVDGGQLTRQEASRMVSSAARSSVGKRGYTPPECSVADDHGDDEHDGRPGHGHRDEPDRRHGGHDGGHGDGHRDDHQSGDLGRHH